MISNEFSSIFNCFLLYWNCFFKGKFSFSKSSTFMSKVSREINPVSSLSIFNFLKRNSFFKELLSKFLDELGNFLEGLEINSGWNLWKSSDDWFKEGFVWKVGLEFLHYCIILWSDLSERSTKLEVINEFGTFIDSSKGGCKISIFSSPYSVLVITVGLFFFLSSLVASKISNSLSKISFRFSKCSNSIITKKCVSNTLSIVISNIVFNILGDSSTSWELDSAKGIRISLTIIQWSQ